MQVDTALEFDTFPVEQPVNVYLMVLVKADSAQNETKRRPLNLSLVIDRSGSMAGAKIDYTRRAAGMLVQNLGVADMLLRVVLYNDTVDTLLMPEKVQRKDIINQQIQRITPSGATNLSGGWLQGCNLVAMHLESGQTNRVILISDGLANRGVTETEKLVSFAKQKYGDGISTTAMGLGDDFNEELLMALSNAGGGAYYYIDSPEVMPTILNEELTGLLKLVGQNLTISVSGPAASVRQMNAYPEESSAAGKTFRLGDMFGDEIKALVLELQLPAFAAEGTRELATLLVEYDQLTESGATHQTIQRIINVSVSGNASTPIRAANPSVIEQVMLLKAAQARRRAVELADNGKFGEASQVLEAVIEEINESAVGEVPLLVDEKKSLAKQATDLSHTAANPSASAAGPSSTSYVKMRKKMASQAFYTMTSRHNETVVLRERMEAPTEPPPPNLKPLETSTQEQPAANAPKFAQYGGHNYPIEGEEMHFGRAVENDVIINERGVSRYHCVLRKEGELYWLEDTGSTNGTVVNGLTLKGRHSIRAGDIAHIGEAKIRFHDGEAEQQ